MKLLSQEYLGDSVELTFADAPDESDAKTLLIVRVPFEVQDTKSVAWNRYWALKRLQDQIDAIVSENREIMEGR